MTDIYIRRMDAPRDRRRVAGRAIAVLLTLAVVTGVVLGIRAGCRHEASPPALALEQAPDRTTPEREPPEAPNPPVHPAPESVKPALPVAAPPVQAAAPGAADAGARWLAEAGQAETRDDLLEARSLALRVLTESKNEEAAKKAEALLGRVNIALVLSPRAMPAKTDYTVQSGDTLAKLAKENGTTVELLRKSNMVKGSMIRVGDRLRVFNGKFSVHISKSRNDLALSMNGDFFKRYRVGTGQYNRTPVGDFTIDDRIPQPTWWKPDGKAVPYGHPDNELGTHWLSLNIRGYGIHGTWEPDTIGKQASAGCIRLINDEIEELYTLLPVGTPVTIAEQ